MTNYFKDKEKELLKGCGNDFSNGNMPICICGALDDKYTKRYGKYCAECQARLSQLREDCKEMADWLEDKSIEMTPVVAHSITCSPKCSRKYSYLRYGDAK